MKIKILLESSMEVQVSSSTTYNNKNNNATTSHRGWHNGRRGSSILTDASIGFFLDVLTTTATTRCRVSTSSSSSIACGGGGFRRNVTIMVHGILDSPDATAITTTITTKYHHQQTTTTIGFTYLFDSIACPKSLVSRSHTRPLKAFCVGALATITTYPLQLAQTVLRFQTKNYRGTLDCWMRLYEQGGFGKLYTGMRAKLLQTVLTAAFTFLTYEQILGVVQAAFLPYSIKGIKKYTTTTNEKCD
jgi:hypothetical protein